MGPRIQLKPEQIEARNRRVVAGGKSGLTITELARIHKMQTGEVSKVLADAGVVKKTGLRSWA